MDQASAASGRSPGKASIGKLAVLYDGACGMCRASAEAIRTFDNGGRLELLDLHDEATRALFPDLKLQNLLEELHVVDDQGRVYRGARAVNEVLGQAGIWARQILLERPGLKEAFLELTATPEAGHAAAPR